VEQTVTEAQANDYDVLRKGMLNDTGIDKSIITYLAEVYAEILKHRGTPLCYAVKIGPTDTTDVLMNRWNDIVAHVHVIELDLIKKNLPSLKDKFLI
jgi:hypothetical protein